MTSERIAEIKHLYRGYESVQDLCNALEEERERTRSFEELSKALDVMNNIYRTQAFHKPVGNKLERLAEARTRVAALSREEGGG